MKTKRLIIYLSAAQPLKASWLLLDESNQVLELATESELSNLHHPDIATTVIVPGEDVLLTHATLPKMSRQRLLQALPFALEDKLIDDVQHLHFAIGPYQADQAVPVAIVTKQKMESWLSQLAEYNITPNIMIPATLALPVLPEHWLIAIDHSISMVRTGPYSGFTCDKDNLKTFLDIQLTETVIKPSGLTIYDFSTPAFEITLDPLIIQHTPMAEKQLIECFQTWTTEYPSINLLQGPYHAKPKNHFKKNVWVLASYFALAWVGALLLSHLVSFFILKQAGDEAEKSIHAIYKRHFPDATAIVAPRDRFEAKLKQFSGDANKNHLLSLLSTVGQQLSNTVNVRLQSLDFRENLLNLTIVAASFEQLDTFVKALTQAGLQVKQQNAGMMGAEVKANIIINKGGA